MNEINDILARVASIAEQNNSRFLSIQERKHLDYSMPVNQ